MSGTVDRLKGREAIQRDLSGSRVGQPKPHEVQQGHGPAPELGQSLVSVQTGG